MDSSALGLEFLDLTGASEHEVGHLNSVLYGGAALANCSVELPWSPPPPVHWNGPIVHQPYPAAVPPIVGVQPPPPPWVTLPPTSGEEPINGGTEDPQSIEGSVQIIRPTVSNAVPIAYSIPMHPQTSVIVSNVTANVNVHGFQPMYNPGYQNATTGEPTATVPEGPNSIPRRQRTNKITKRLDNGQVRRSIDSPQQGNYTPSQHQFSPNAAPYIPTQVSPPYTYYTSPQPAPAGISPQAMAGSPLYFPSPMQAFPTPLPVMYPPGTTVYSATQPPRPVEQQQQESGVKETMSLYQPPPPQQQEPPPVMPTTVITTVVKTNSPVISNVLPAAVTSEPPIILESTATGMQKHGDNMAEDEDEDDNDDDENDDADNEEDEENYIEEPVVMNNKIVVENSNSRINQSNVTSTNNIVLTSSANNEEAGTNFGKKSPVPSNGISSQTLEVKQMVTVVQSSSISSTSASVQPFATKPLFQSANKEAAKQQIMKIEEQPSALAPVVPVPVVVAAPSGRTWASVVGSPSNDVEFKPTATVKPTIHNSPGVNFSNLNNYGGSSCPNANSNANGNSINNRNNFLQSGKSTSSITDGTGTSNVIKPNLASPCINDDPRLLELGNFLVKYQLEHKAAALQPRGLTNRSNYCYINAILQALLACPPLYNLLKAVSKFKRNCINKTKSFTPIIDSMVKFMNEFDEMNSSGSLLKSRREKAQARKEEQSPGGSSGIDVVAGAAFEPTYVYKMLNVIRNDTAFPVEGRQEDAEEFLSCLLNGLNDEMLELQKLANNNLSNGEVTTNGEIYQDIEGENEWKEVTNARNKQAVTRRTEVTQTPLSQIFQGQLRSSVQRVGTESTDNIQPFYTLPLDIENAQSVKEALDRMVGKDILEGVTCTKTNQKVEAWQQVTLEQLPHVLLLHLKCFDYKLHTCSKIIKTVEFPIDLKIEPKWLSPVVKNKNKKGQSGNSGKERQYKLFAVVYHDGKEATKGHYITDVYHVGYGWVRYDDAIVRAVSENLVLRPKSPRVPYLLYYRRMDTINPSQPTKSQKSDS